MHRLNVACTLLLGTVLACGGDKKPAADPSKTTDTSSDVGGGDDKPPHPANSDAPAGDKSAGEKKDVCVGHDIANLEDVLLKSECEVPDTRPDAVPNPDLKGKLEVTVSASPTKVAPGAKADLLVTFTNKSKEPLTLHFRIDPVARFETEAFDGKKKRVDMPAGQPPPPPKGHSAPPPADAKVAKVTVAAGGAAHARVPWDAVKMKWAPEKVRGTAVEKGYPRAPAGPLPKGKYSVRVVTPLVGVFEGGEHEVSAPKVEIEVG
jgi:hypothetical protein